MFHFPLNHPLNGFYRGIAVITAVVMVIYPLAFSYNVAFAVVMMALAVVVLLGQFAGRDRFPYINEIVGGALILLGIGGLLVLKSDHNYLGLSVSSVVVLFVLGSMLLTAGMYTKTGTAEQARVEEAYRHSGTGLD